MPIYLTLTILQTYKYHYKSSCHTCIQHTTYTTCQKQHMHTFAYKLPYKFYTNLLIFISIFFDFSRLILSKLFLSLCLSFSLCHSLLLSKIVSLFTSKIKNSSLFLYRNSKIILPFLQLNIKYP